MRNLYDCKAEIFRRSEQRIQKRRQNRRRILACCVPAVLCITVCAAMFLPVKKDGSEHFDGLTGGISLESYVCSYVEVTIQQGANAPQRITDKAAVTRIFEAVFQPDWAVHAETGTEPEKASGSLIPPAEYIITFMTEDGSKTVYTLDENILFSIKENSRILLSDAQVSQLKAALGIRDP